MRKLYISVICTLLTWSFVSCDDFLSEYSQDMVIAKTVTHLDEVLLGDVYIRSSAVSYGPSSGRCGFLNILDDDVNTAKGGTFVDASGNERPIFFNVNVWNFCVSPIFGYFAWQENVGINAQGTNIADDNVTWDDLYSRINKINVILDEIVDMPHETDEDDAAYYRVQGEAHFLRAQFYLILANLYGKPYSATDCEKNLCVPLKLTPYVEHDNDKETQFERATVKDVYNQIVDDLTKAEEFLTRSPQNPKNRLHRASAEAASLLLSRVYLYMQKWDLAEQKASLVLESPNFMLAGISTLGNGLDFLNEDNPEIIFSQGPNYLPMAGPGSNQYAFSALSGNFCVSSDLANIYDQINDRRFSCFFGKAEGDSLALENKYNTSTWGMQRISDVFTLRMAEAYLNKMEACAMQSGKEAEANLLLNTLRAQRIDSYSDQTYSGEELVQQIRDERRKELCFEGHRWFDLRRYSVCTTYPFSKPIIHVFNEVNDKGNPVKVRTYRLEEHDLAYTFAIPTKVLSFDKVPMQSNPREKRMSLEEMNPENNE